MRVELHRHQSRLLADNPLGDPAQRDVILLLPPSYEAATARRYPVVLVLPGYGGTGWQLAYHRSAWTAPFERRIGDAMRSGKVREAILVLPDCFTRYGGSQYVDSPAIGRYQSYLADELFAFVDATARTIPRREARAVVGKSSGGYGALVLAMQRPDVACAIAAHAADGAFELSYLRDLPKTVLALEKRGGIPAFLQWFDAQPMKGQHAFDVMSHLCCAAAWSPTARGPFGYGSGFDFPLHLLTAAVRDEVWSRWLAWDPVRMVDTAALRAGLGGLSALFLDAGLADEHNLQLATRQLAARLAQHGVACTHEEFEGGHYNTQYRYERSLAVVTAALATD